MNQDSLAQIAYAGEWSIEPGKDPETCTFALHYPPSASNCGGPLALADLGLAGLDLAVAQSRLRFEVRREAGTFECEGTVASGRGRGAFRFRPDAAYARAIVEAGIPPLTLAKHVQAGMFAITLSFVRAILATGMPDVTFAQLLSLKIFRLTPEYVGAFRAAFPNDGPDEMVALGVLRVTPEYVEALQRAQIRGLRAANVSALRASGIEQSFIESLVASGRRGLSIDEVVSLHRTAS